MPPNQNVRLIHTSDTHLGDDWRADLSEQAFRRVIDSVALLHADALLVVGDVFDHARVPDRVLNFYLAQIARLHCPVITLPGNHDLYHADSLYRRAPFQDPPPNFYLFTDCAGQTIRLPHLPLDLWGRAMPEHTPDFHPLAGMPPANPGRWLVALAHGHYHFPEDQDLRSSPIQPAEVANAPCHYLALGHWERHIEVSQGDTVACYSGSRGHTVAYYSGSPLGASPDNHHISINQIDLNPKTGITVNQIILPLNRPSPSSHP